MLIVASVAKSYGTRRLFSDVSFQVRPGDRIGLVGPNGAGKSTLFSLILQDESPDEGSISVERGTTLGFLPQESAVAGDETALEIATAISGEFQALRRQFLSAPTAAHEDLPVDDDPAGAHARFEQLGGYTVDPKAKRILAGLGFRESDFDRPARTFSGGWAMRAHLARLLVQEPDLLLLDEPTNHLDLSALLWLENYLQDYGGGILTISHDRYFLNRLCNAILHVEDGRIARYTGNYDAFLEQKTAREEQLLAEHRNQQREIAHLQRFIDRFGSKNTKATQAKSKQKQLDRIERIEAPGSTGPVLRFSFPQPTRSGLKAVTLSEIHHAYGEVVVYRGIDFSAERGERIVLVGPNGAGKSTLIKLLAGVLPVQAGIRELGHNVKAGYFAQHRIENLDPAKTVLEEAWDVRSGGDGWTEHALRPVLGSFLFRGDDVFKKISVLSGGEKSRLALVKLLLDPPNLLLMDEPTTHLDIPGMDALIAALQAYTGTLIFISHDVHFIRQLATRVVHVDSGRLTSFPGGYDYFLEKSRADSSGRSAVEAQLGSRARSPEKDPGTSGPSRSREQKRLEAEARQAVSRERRRRREHVAELEAKITRLEERQAELIQLLENPDTYQRAGAGAELNRELADLVKRLQALNAEWEREAAAVANDTASA